MRKLFLLLGLWASLGAMEMDQEIDALNRLTEATQASLDNQKKLRVLLMEYQKASDAYFQDEESKDALLALVKAAHKLLESIKENHLTQTFSQEFLNDLAVFSQVAQKRV